MDFQQTVMNRTSLGQEMRELARKRLEAKNNAQPAPMRCRTATPDRL